MKTCLISVAVSLTYLVSFPAVAGPNWEVIHKAEEAEASHRHTALVLPLDHGPRALTTPWQNAERVARMEAKRKQNALVASHAHHAQTHS